MSETSWNHTQVKCLAGSRANERPVSFALAGRETPIHLILESWREPEYLYFKVETIDGRAYELRHHEYEDFWEVKNLDRH